MPDGRERPWPAVDLPETYRILSAPGQAFEMEEKAIRGVTLRAYRHGGRAVRRAAG